MLLLLQATSNRIFVTNEKLFLRYSTMDPQATWAISLAELLGSQRAAE
ncbi:MAG: hypothetical protein OJF52_000720 [Nitrospira sp.]|jgi:hypothetical protein|nr:MAG: hypothetical protein OJF52_000720 [Nitrospira sp.]